MTWIGLRDTHTQAFSVAGIAAQGETAPSFPDTALLKQGSLQFEFSYTPRKQRQILLDHRGTATWPFRLRISITPEAVLHFDLICGDTRNFMVLDTGLTDCEPAVELVFSWHAPDRIALLSMHLPYTGRSAHRAVYDPAPLPLTVLRSLTHDRVNSNGLTYFAISTDIEPVGPSPGLAGHALVETPRGPEYIARIKPGDRVLCKDGIPQRVLWSGHRDVPARGRFQPIRLRAPYFDLCNDTVVAPTQAIAFEGPDVEYLFGEERVLISASHAVGGIQAHSDPRQNVMRYHQILLEDHALIRISGGIGESLYVGDLAADAMALNASIWSGICASRFPRHRTPAAPVLKHFEAVSLTRTFV